MNKEFFTGKTVLVMGLGRFGGGVDVAKFACGAGAKVIITDLASRQRLSDSIKQLGACPSIEYHLGGHVATDFEEADIIVANPAVAGDNEFLKIARQQKKFITSQINIFFELCPASIIGITGANGKSTTTALTAHLLRSQIGRKDFKYSNVWLSGNIGNEPLLGHLDRISSEDLVVLELSSFQIEQLAQIKKAPQIALLTNLTPNHLDRHGSFANYCQAKENIFKFQKLDKNYPAVSIFNAEDKVGAEWLGKYKSDVGRRCIGYSVDDVNEEIRQQFRLPGRANTSNLAAAIAIARCFTVDYELIKACLPKFKSLPHRLEFVAESNGVKWYNDSIATTPQSVIVALDAFEQPKIIIAGGYDKNLSFDELGGKIAEKAKAAILIGQTAPKIAHSIKLCCPKCLTTIEMVNTLDEAVDLARRLAVSGDVVLLSPACASYDMFDNFQHRGQIFRELVNKLCH